MNVCFNFHALFGWNWDMKKHETPSECIHKNPCAILLNYTPPAGLVNFEVDKANSARSHPNSIKLYKNTIKHW
jgi:hypothetical protein